MRRFTIALVTAVSSIALTQMASAADLPRKAPAYQPPPPPPVVYNWTGFYIGGHIGGSWANVDLTHTNTDGIVEDFYLDDGGFVYGGHVGAMYQWGNIVLGIEGTYSRHDLSNTSPATLVDNRSISFDFKNMATVVGRLGYAWDRWLVYGQGGWAAAETDFTRFRTSDTLTTANSSDWDNGWTVGVGAAYAITQISFLDCFEGAGFNDTVTNAHADIHQVVARLSFKFP